MTIRHLQIFKAVAEAGKMGQAARQLYISQPTVSKAIGDLEKEYGVLLFDRLAQKLYITEAGTRLLRYARQLLALYDEMEADLHAAAGLQAIRVGATITVGSCVLPALIRRFEQEHPGVRVQVEVESARRIEQKILNSELDLAVSEGEPESGELLAVPVIRDELVLISNPAHPLAGRETVPPAALNGEPFVLREEGSGTRAGLDRFLQDNGLQVYPKWTCQSFDAVLRAVEEGQGLSAVSRRWADPLIAQERLCRLNLEGPPLIRNFQLIRHRGKQLTPAMEAFCAAVEKEENASLLSV